MLRISRNLQPRVPNLAATLSAILLMVTTFIGAGDSQSGKTTPANWLASLPQASAETAQAELSEAPTSGRKGFKISLMMFH